MAKKTPARPAEKPAAKKPAAKKPAAAKSTLARARSAVVHAAEAVVEAVTHAAEAAQSHVVTPVAEAVGIVKAKPARKKKAPAKPAAMPARSKTTSGKMMSKNVTAAPKDEPTRGPKSKARPKP